MTVQEWLGADNQLGIDIWEKKYRYKDESFDEWLDRVSGSNDNVRQLIKEKKFLFGGRILANRGLENKGRKISLSNCFIAGTKITTKNGLVNIEDIRPGDVVLTSDGSWQEVNDVMSRDYDGDMYKIRAKGAYESIICTPNHKFLTQNGWKRADRLLAGNHDGRIKSPDKLSTFKEASTKEYGAIDYIDIYQIDVLENQSTKVYNLSVENNHSYVANGVIVHNCYVVAHPEDSIESIFDCAKKLARTYSYGGGCGIDISALSPRGAVIHNAAKETSGSVSFMDLYSLVTELIGQNGRRKRLNTIHRKCFE